MLQKRMGVSEMHVARDQTLCVAAKKENGNEKHAKEEQRGLERVKGMKEDSLGKGFVEMSGISKSKLS